MDHVRLAVHTLAVRNGDAERCRTGCPRCSPATLPAHPSCKPILHNDTPGHKGQDHQQPTPRARSSTPHACRPATCPGRPPSGEDPVGCRTPTSLLPRAPPPGRRRSAVGRHGSQNGPCARPPHGGQARDGPRARAPPPPRAGGGVGEAPPQLQQLWPPRQAREAALPPPGRRKPMLDRVDRQGRLSSDAPRHAVTGKGIHLSH